MTQLVPVRKAEAVRTLPREARSYSNATSVVRHYAGAETDRRSNAIAEELLLLEDVAQDLAWQGNAERRAQARARLLGGGSLAVDPVLRAVARTPRVEVQEEAAELLAELARSDAALDEIINVLRAGEHSPSARAAAVRALGWAVLSEGTRSRVVEALGAALLDPAAEVRDAAANAMQDVGGSRALELLREASAGESDRLVRAAIDEAVRTLQ
jgi:HEAT repeat protein